VIRIDGSGYRQITDDEYRNRGPAWSADGSTISFYSNRNGRYQAWSVRPDGSGLEPLTNIGGGSIWFPEWSHDGTRISVAGMPATRILDPARPLGEREVQLLPATPDGLSFQASSWSPDGSRLAGAGQKTDGATAGVFVYHLGSGRYERVAGRGRTPSLLADGRRLLYEDAGEVVFVDPATQTSRTVLSIGAPVGIGNQRRFRLSRDNRWIVFFRSEIEADIWLMSLE
jgi:Tol biopolymer transport system component